MKYNGLFYFLLNYKIFKLGKQDHYVLINREQHPYQQSDSTYQQSHLRVDRHYSKTLSHLSPIHYTEHFTDRVFHCYFDFNGNIVGRHLKNLNNEIIELDEDSDATYMANTKWAIDQIQKLLTLRSQKVSELLKPFDKTRKQIFQHLKNPKGITTHDMRKFSDYLKCLDECDFYQLGFQRSTFNQFLQKAIKILSRTLNIRRSSTNDFNKYFVLADDSDLAPGNDENLHLASQKSQLEPTNDSVYAEEEPMPERNNVSAQDEADDSKQGDISYVIERCNQLIEQINALEPSKVEQYHILHQELILERIPLIDIEPQTMDGLSNINDVITAYKTPDDHAIELVTNGDKSGLEQILTFTSNQLPVMITELIRELIAQPVSGKGKSNAAACKVGTDEVVANSIDTILSNPEYLCLDTWKILLSIMQFEFRKDTLTFKSFLLKCGWNHVFLVLTKHFPELGLRPMPTGNTRTSDSQLKLQYGVLGNLLESHTHNPHNKIFHQYLAHGGAFNIKPQEIDNGLLHTLSIKDSMVLTKSGQQSSINTSRKQIKDHRKKRNKKSSSQNIYRDKRIYSQTIKGANLIELFFATSQHLRISLGHDFFKLYFEKAGIIDSIARLFHLLEQDDSAATIISRSCAPLAISRCTEIETDKALNHVKSDACLDLFTSIGITRVCKNRMELINNIIGGLELYLKQNNIEEQYKQINDCLSYSKKHEINNRTAMTFSLLHTKALFITVKAKIQCEANVDNYMRHHIHKDITEQSDIFSTFNLCAQAYEKKPTNKFNFPEQYRKKLIRCGIDCFNIAKELEKLTPEERVAGLSSQYIGICTQAKNAEKEPDLQSFSPSKGR
ncbi:MAG: hypothetical protein ACON5A_02700 [Candidatus Comchoanobacterales bacterium]